MSDTRQMIFRKAALDRLSSPEQLDRLVTVTDTKGWVAAAGLGLILAVLGAWSVFGRIPTEVPANGILVVQGGRVVSATSPAGGMVEQVLVEPGGIVARGQRVATIRQGEVEQRLANARQMAAERGAVLERHREAAAREREVRRANAEQRRAAASQAIQAAEERAAFLARQEASRRELLARGFSSADALEQVRAQLNAAKLEVSQNRSRLLEIDSQQIEADLVQTRRTEELEAALMDAQRAVRELEARIGETATVLAPADGRVTEVAAPAGAVVAPGAMVVAIETAGDGLQAVVYIPTEHGKKVRPGMVARVAPATVKKEEVGTLLGRVVSVSDFPATPDGMRAVLQNPGLVAAMAGGKGPPYEARIDLERADTPSGFAWSSGRGPELDLTSGTTLSTEITVREEPPLNLILPILRGAVGASP